MFRRIGLFLILNFLVMMSIGLLIQILGLNQWLTQGGLEYGTLMGFCLVWGMGGAFISLLLSKTMAKWSMRVQVIDPHTHDNEAQRLLMKVHALAKSAGLSKMPEVGIYDSPEINAFATGPSRNNSLVAVSSGLLHRMDEEEVEGVLAHEVAHIANGDMVTMALMQGVVNAFVMFLSRILAFAITQALSSRNSDSSEGRGGAVSPMVFYLVTMLLEFVLMIFGSMLVAWFSRYREFRADAGGARLGGRRAMTRALRKLQSVYDSPLGEDAALSSGAVQTLKISSKRGRMFALFSTHPPLEERIARLEQMTSV